MFDRIARVYDLMNGVMTAGLHHRWRRRAVELAALVPGDRVLDIATGTGDLAFELGHRVAPEGVVVAADFSENMLEIARRKQASLRALTTAPAGVEIRFEAGNALDLAYPDGEFAAATVGFGARNFSDLERGLSEMARVVRPGGRVVVLEITTPTEGLLATGLRVWFDRVIPLVGRVAGDADAYTYLPSSVRRFPPPRELAALMAKVGLSDVRYVLTAGGIIALHVGTVPRRDRGCRVSAEGTTQVTTDWVAIDAVRAAGGEPVSRLMERLEQRLVTLATGHGPDLGAFAGSTISAGGKRLRPLLVFLAAGVPTPETEVLLSAAVSVELVHAATLVHDDVLDGSELRRGRPTVVATAGRAAATATGDLLFSRAFAELRRLDSASAIRILSRASSELAAGELMQRADAWRAVDAERYFDRCRLKTAVLFRAACELGATAGGASVQVTEELAEFGERIGLAFQLLDDVLDVTGPPERTGKPRGADLLDGTVTLPLILAGALDPELAALDLHAIRTAAAAARVCERIAGTDALQKARAQAFDLVASAKRLLPGLPDRQRAALDLVADGVVERYA